MKRHPFSYMGLLGLIATTLLFSGCKNETVPVESETMLETSAETTALESVSEPSYPGMDNTDAETPETGDAETETETEEVIDDWTEKKIIVATDIHYLAKNYSGKNSESFLRMTRESDGRVLQYGWEILDAFLDDVRREEPDLVLFTGDLTLNGEKKSHEELAGKLGKLMEEGIEVIVLPGNHDINNPDARAYTEDGSKKVASTTPEEFEAIYEDFGYSEALYKDPNSLSYIYPFDDSHWLLMLDSCQYEPVAQVGGMIRRETYEWMKPLLEEAWNEGIRVISASHHNLLDQSGISRVFYDDCTIEHNEQLMQILGENEVGLHLSGHLHVQHGREDEDYGVREMVTGSLVMSPCHYAVLRILEDGSYVYDATSVDVEGWARRRKDMRTELKNFKEFSDIFLGQRVYTTAYKELQKLLTDGEVYFAPEVMEEMANFYAMICVHYYGGRMHELGEEITKDPNYKRWMDIEYISAGSDVLRNIFEEENKDFLHWEIPY